MKDQELVNAIRRLKVETGSLACMGCGHEHNCGVSGCAVMREAADRIANQSAHIAALQQEIENLRGQLPRWIPVEERMPEDHAGRCLVCASGPHGSVIFIGLYFASVHSWVSDMPYYSPLPPVTHWMPLPTDPEVDL